MQKQHEWIANTKTVSEANSSEHWSSKSKRHKMQKKWVKLLVLQNKPLINLPCKIKLSRIAPRLLDSDNLLSSLKYIRDAMSENILCLIGEYKHISDIQPGTCDNDPRFIWEYDQEKGNVRQYAVKIEIFF